MEKSATSVMLFVYICQTVTQKVEVNTSKRCLSPRNMKEIYEFKHCTPHSLVFDLILWINFCQRKILALLWRHPCISLDTTLRQM